MTGLILNRYWESIKKWNEAIQLTPDHDVLHEMKAQVPLIKLLTFIKYTSHMTCQIVWK